MVSLIIPTYNRSHLLGATLDSIRVQTYNNWECIVVDDGSTDYIFELMEFYCANDSRIKFFSRPENHRKGANACRNYGFEKSRGEYIQWFDSDDLMVSNFLETKLNILIKNQVDFVISKSANFRDPDPNEIVDRNEKYYKFDRYEVNNFNYISHRINWLTYDFFSKRGFVTNYKFNELLKSGQERDFFSRITLQSFSYKIIDEYLTLRRIHTDSIRGVLITDPGKRKYEDQVLTFETWKYISLKKPGSDAEKFLLFKILSINRRYIFFSNFTYSIFKILVMQDRYRVIFSYILYKIIYLFTGKGLYFRKLFMNSL